jgi:hypothetical protein
MVMRRTRTPGGRPLSSTVALSVQEAAVVRIAAARAGMAVGAWLGQAGVRAAVLEVQPGAVDSAEQMQQLMMVRAEVMETRRVLRNIGGNLNDVAAHANSTGEIHPATQQVLQLVERAVARVDAVVADLDAAITAGVQALQASRRSR